jgi:hypothetical protein
LKDFHNRRLYYHSRQHRMLAGYPSVPGAVPILIA